MEPRVKGISGAKVAMAVAAFAAGAAMPASAQPSDGALLGNLRACARIEDPGARLACYDGNFPPGASPAAAGTGGGARVAAGGAGSFGAESIKSPDRFESSAQRDRGADEIRPRVLDARQREPGIYLVTIEDGAQWLFSEPVPRNFRPPRKGALVEIKRASLGSFLMVVDGQSAVRVRRVK